jgi:maltose O-acetyltransferase
MIRYEKNGSKIPKFTNFSRKFLYLNKIPILRNIAFIRKKILKIYNFPESTSINNKFYLSAPLAEIGNNVGLADTFILAYAPVIVGDNCSFSFKNIIITSAHDYNDFSIITAKPVVIKKNVWITTNVTILPGVTIGENTIIGAGSVVTHDIPAGVFAAGNPCKVVKYIIFNK